MTIDDPQSFLRALFDAAVAAADPIRRVPAFLPERPAGRVLVVGGGKASARMAEAVEAAWGPCEGLVVTRYGHARPCRGIEIVEAAHPVPDEAGIAATRRMLDLVAGAREGDLVLALISGGGSALLCAPGRGLTLEDKQALVRRLLASGAPIGEINTVRKQLSAVKGGRLAAAAYPARTLALMISDVPGDDPADIASGPTVGDSGTAERALSILNRRGVEMPRGVASFLAKGGMPVLPDDPRLALTENVVIAAPIQSLEAAAEAARRAGATPVILGDAIEGEAREVAAGHVAEALRRQAARAPGDPPIVLLSGGEVTVTGFGNGVGGPNAEYALAAALALADGAGGRPGVHLIACDTDGVDGAAEIAGARIGPDTFARARAAGLVPAAALAEHDSHGFFAALGDGIVTGPTLTNVNDFRAILIA
jgi:hydroxypyruvate reductase